MGPVKGPPSGGFRVPLLGGVIKEGGHMGRLKKIGRMLTSAWFIGAILIGFLSYQAFVVIDDQARSSYNK